MFELNFRDERYLPFEYQGAVSRWRIELPPENNYFDLDTVTDVVLHLNYTAREGGEALREAAAARRRGAGSPATGCALFDVRHDFPDAWPRPGGQAADEPRGRVAGRPAQPRRCGWASHRRCSRSSPAAGPHHRPAAADVRGARTPQPGRHHLVRFWRDDDGHERATEFECVADGAWPGFFCGTVDLREHPLGPLRDERPVDVHVRASRRGGRSATSFARYAPDWPTAARRPVRAGGHDGQISAPRSGRAEG